MREMVTLIAKAPGWKKLDIQFQGTDARGPNGERMSTAIFKDLLWLRGMEQVRCPLPKNELLVQKLSKLTEPGPSIFLYDLNDALIQYCKPLLLQELGRARMNRKRLEDPLDDAFVERIWDRLARGVTTAVVAEDLPRFLEQRRILMKMMNLLTRYRQDRVLGHDAVDQFNADYRGEPGMLQLVGGLQSDIDSSSSSTSLIETGLNAYGFKALYELPLV
jgi:hypothetical protein